MSKFVKKTSIILVILILLCTIMSTYIYAAQSTIPNPDEYEPGSEAAPAKITNMLGTIANIVQVVGIVFAVVILIMLGIKYMVGSVEERADYKKTMIPYLVGTVLIFGIGTILKLINNLTTSVIK